MITLYRLKPEFQALLRPAARALDRSGMTANQVTVCACLGSVALGAWLALYGERAHWYLLLPLWCLARSLMFAAMALLAVVTTFNRVASGIRNANRARQ